MVNGLSLFSGIGGFELALAPWVTPVAYCEIDPFCQAVLLSRMADGSLPAAPIWPDVRTLPVQDLPAIDIVYGGFPCQDLSVAGDGAGLDGSRSGLVFDAFNLARQLRPRFVFLENVPALAVRGLDRLLLELDAMGFDARWTIVSAAEMGAQHLRERLWILAHTHSARLEGLEPSSPPRSALRQSADFPLERVWSGTDCPSLRVDDELPRPVDRIRALGNAIVPQAAREAFIRLGGLGMTHPAPLFLTPHPITRQARTAGYGGFRRGPDQRGR